MTPDMPCRKTLSTMIITVVSSWCAAPPGGLIAQPVQPLGQEAGPPLAHGAPVHPQPRGDGDIGPAVRAGQHDPRPQRLPLRGLPPLRPVLQRPPPGPGQHQRLQRAITHTASTLHEPADRNPGHGAGLPGTKSASRGAVTTQDRDTRCWPSTRRSVSAPSVIRPKSTGALMLVSVPAPRLQANLQRFPCLHAPQPLRRRADVKCGAD